ncbi:hypothetical protein Lal_00034863 [Lupinus albus]|uniref:Putative multi antimicrobial extrusion protein n=1 Tax=Lupinus albus TaxID=3870 RepID=A0A6A5PKK8_LUPAL|nr:putative multi antimicrobial extrusion protein [Lupinus albus]KAF1897160.1 hypothetical protein Lal_00034863 [Lupinus albus]
MASIYCFYSLPDLLTNTFLQPLRVFLMSQKVTKPMMYCSLVAVAFHLPLNYLLVVVMELGVRGVAMASVITNMNMLVLMVGYVWLWRENDMVLKWVSWGGGEMVCGGLGQLMKLAVPSCFMICLEWWWYEIVTDVWTTSMMYTLPMALAGCVSDRVGNELGACKPYKAKLAAMVALGCAFGLGFINVTWTVILGHRWAGLFTSDESVKALVTSVMPIMGLCELGNYPQTTGCGILGGTARPVIGAHINLGSFYIVGTPVAIGLAFWFKVGFCGLWSGLLSAQLACAMSIVYVVMARTDWEAEKLTRAEMSSCNEHRSIENENDEENKTLLVNGNSNKDDIV